MVYEDLKLKVNTNFNTVNLPTGQQIKVFEYLPVEDKMDLIEIALEKAEESNYYNPIKLEVFFNIYLIKMYTDIVFPDEQEKSLLDLYNEFESSGVLDLIIEAIPDDEYDYLQIFLKQIKKEKEKYKRSVVGILDKLVYDMPKNAEAISQIINNFDPQKYKEVMDFAKAANGGREI